MISLYDILEAANGQLYGEPVAQIFTDFCIDPDKAGEGLLYVALRSDRGDTHQYIEEAIKNGASGVICSKPPNCDTDGVSVVFVQDAVDALVAWAHLVLGKLGTKVIGVTGSSGKSVTAAAINRVLSKHHSVHCHIVDYLDGQLSVPLALARLKPEHKYVVLKLGIAQPGEMAEMVQAVQPDVGVITHIGYAHTDTFGEPEQIALEKRILVEYLSPNGVAVLNYDDDLVRAMGKHTRAEVMTIGIDSFGTDLMAFNAVVGLNGTGFDLRYGGERYVGRWVPLPGKYNLYAVLSALAVGLHYDIPVEDSLKTLKELSPLPGRLNPLIGLNNSLLVDDSHTAEPQSALAALDWLDTIKEGHRAIFVMGDMENLGAYSQFGHRQVGQRAAEVADLIITEGTEASLLGRAALDQGMDPSRIRSLHSTQDTIATLKENIELNEKDIVLIKGGPSSRMELVTQSLLMDESDHEQLTRRDFGREAPVIVQHTRANWVEIDTNALASNVAFTREMLDDDVMMMAVVKSDAYGHGAVAVSKTALLNGAEYLGVASINEALELRDAGIDAPILILNHMPVFALRQAIRHNIAIALYDLDMARSYDRAARELHGKLRVHVKVDTGMGRLGVLAEEAISMFRHLKALQNIEIEGIYTHFSSADENLEYTEEQIENFNSVLRPLRASEFEFKYVHAANSAGILGGSNNHFNMVRAGIMLYGLRPSNMLDFPAELKPVMSWKTVVAQVRDLPPGYPIGYGNTYSTSENERIAILPLGYADGFRRSPQTWREVLVHGQRAPVVGRVSMEKCAINVTDISGVSVGDEVVLLGSQGDETITADEVAEWLGTINYEVVTSILPRVPRY